MRGEGLCGLHVTGGVVSKERNSVPHSVSSCPALRWHEQTINTVFQGPYVRDVFFSFCVYSFDFLTVSSKMSSDSSGFQTNHQDSLTGLCRTAEKTIPKL